MKKILCCFVVLWVQQACIPYSVAPKISNYKIVSGKRFKKGLPKKSLFVFKDPKAAGAFYTFINTKYQLQDYYGM